MKINLIFLLTILIQICCYSQTSIPAYCPPGSVGADAWDWREPMYTFYLRGSRWVTPTNPNGMFMMENPWFSTWANNNNVNVFRSQNPKDFEPDDGWVLVQREFGTPSNTVNHPYFVLYNKYSGIVRIFVAISDVIGQNNSAVISVSYPDTGDRSALLELLSPDGYTNSLIHFNNKIPLTRISNEYTFDLPYWLHADFVMNYDPCTCDHNSSIYFDVSLVSNSTLNFKVNGTAVQNMDNLGRKGSGNQGIPDALQAGQTVIDGGVSFHKSAKSGINMFNEIFPGSNFWAENPLYNVAIGLGGMAGIVTKLFGVFNPTKSDEIQPIVFDIDLKATGDISFSGSHRKTIINSPGSQIVPPTLINYQNPLGVFSLLEPPKVKVTKHTGQMSNNWHTFTLIEDLKFAINPAAGFDLSLSEIHAAFLIDSSNFVSSSYTNMWIHSNKSATSRFYPLSAFRFYTGTAYVQPPFKVRLKIMAILRKYGGDGVLRESVFMATYRTSIINETKSFLGYYGYVLDPVPFDLFISSGAGTLYESGYYPQVNPVYSFNNIYISSSMNVKPNDQPVISGGKSVTVLPGGKINAGMTIKTGLPPNYSFKGPIIETSPQSYCASSSYISRVNEFRFKNSLSGTKKEKEHRLFSIDVFPNPSDGLIICNVILPTASLIKIELCEMNGRTIDTIYDGYVESENVEIPYQKLKLNAGVYLCTLITKDIRITRKIVIK